MSVKHKMIRAMFGLMGLPTCEEVEQFAYDFLEGVLDSSTMKAVERHLKACKNCQRFIAAYRKTASLGKTFQKPTLDPEFKENLFEFLAQKAGGKV
ncbi:MAG: zf-HC2 domain-containing protein [Deltaproteobacteria bacterium]|nr:zf-HC2 domain-containing protein [Deltaproteobacteria bacterium]